MGKEKAKAKRKRAPSVYIICLKDNTYQLAVTRSIALEYIKNIGSVSIKCIYKATPLNFYAATTVKFGLPKEVAGAT